MKLQPLGAAGCHTLQAPGAGAALHTTEPAEQAHGTGSKTFFSCNVSLVPSTDKALVTAGEQNIKIQFQAKRNDWERG